MPEAGLTRVSRGPIFASKNEVAIARSERRARFAARPVIRRGQIMATETIPESHRDLLEKSQVAILTTKGPDGFPQTTALWFLVEDGAVELSINTSRQKARNLERDDACSVFFIDPENPYRTLEIRSRAKVEPDPDYRLADKVAEKYGADLRQMDQPGDTRIAVTIEPVKVNTYG
jgi:PPOX class probable F420-dependent enzyme